MTRLALSFLFIGTSLSHSLQAQTLVVANMNASTATLIDVATGKSVATLPTGHTPHEVAVSHDGKLAVVTDYGDGSVVGSTITIIDVPARKVARTISVAPHQRPHSAAFLPDNRTVVITAEREGAVLLVDVLTGRVNAVKPTGSRVGHMVAISPDAKTAYVANISPGNLSIVDLAGDAAPIVVPVGPQTEGMNLSADGRTVWMGSNSTGKVFIVDVAARKVIDSIITPSQPYRIAFTADGKTALISNPEADEIRVVDVATHQVRKVVAVAPAGGGKSQPQGIVISPASDKAWVTMGIAGSVAELDLKTATITRWLTTDAGPDGIGLARKQ